MGASLVAPGKKNRYLIEKIVSVAASVLYEHFDHSFEEDQNIVLETSCEKDYANLLLHFCILCLILHRSLLVILRNGKSHSYG